MLRRSGETPIIINWSAPASRHRYPPFTTSLELALAQSQRAVEIRLTGYGQDIEHALRRTSRAPMLQSLDLLNDEDIDYTIRTLPSSVFDGHTPNLRHLVLDNISCSPTLLPTVTHLVLKYCALGADNVKLLQSLANSPHLESLHVVHWDEAVVDTRNSSEAVALLSLRELVIKGNIAPALTLLCHLYTPALSRFVLKDETSGLLAEDVLADFLQRASPMNRAIVTEPLRHLSICIGRYDLLVDAWYTPPLNYTDNPNSDVSLSLSIFRENVSATLSIITEILRTRYAISLRLFTTAPKHNAGVISTLIPDLLFHLSALRSCVVEGWLLSYFLNALRHLTQNGIDRSQDTIEELTLLNCDFGAAGIAASTESLLAYARTKNRFARLKRVRLVRCEEVYDGWLDALREVVDLVECSDLPCRRTSNW